QSAGSIATGGKTGKAERATETPKHREEESCVFGAALSLLGVFVSLSDEGSLALLPRSKSRARDSRARRPCYFSPSGSLRAGRLPADCLACPLAVRTTIAIGLDRRAC